MKKLLIATLLLLSSSAFAEDQPRFLHYMWSDVTVISISNIDCPFKEFSSEYKKVSLVTNTMDGNRVFGCYREEVNEMIKIQWYKGDISAFPANAFLIHKLPKEVREAIEPKEIPKPTL
jgi:hypothetical protein